MNILMVADVFYPDTIGGSGRVVYEVSKRLANRGYQVYVLVPRLRRELLPKETREGIRIRRYPVKSWNALTFILSSLFNSRRVFNQILQEVSFDLIHFNQPLSAQGISGSRRIASIPRVYHFYSPWHREYEVRYKKRGMGSFFRKRMEGKVLSSCQRIIVLSEYSKEQVISIHKIPASRIEVIPGGVDIEKFKLPADKKGLREKLHIAKEKFLLFTVRELVPRMGLENLVSAMKDVVKERRDVLLIIGGEGFLRSELEAMVEELKLGDYIKFKGMIKEEQLPLYYQAADLFILPTRYLEGFGLVTLEALASGTPVLGTPIGGTKEILGRLNGELLFEGTDAHSISRLILKFITLGKKDMSRRYRQFVIDHYSWEKVISRIEKVYKEVAERY